MTLTIDRVAYGWLTLTGTMHFAIDVLSQYFRGVRAPSAETTLYYGLNASYSLGQVVLGAIGLWLAWRSPELLRQAPAVAVSAAAAVGWLAIAIFYMEYTPPRVAAGIFCALLVAASIIR